MKNLKDKWNYNDWQGRSKKKVEDSYEYLAWTIAIGFIAIVSVLIYQSLTGL